MFESLKQWWKRVNAPEPARTYKKVWINVGAYLVDYHFNGGRSLTKKYTGHAYYTQANGLTLHRLNNWDMRKTVAEEGTRRLYTTNTIISGIIWDDKDDVGFPHRDLINVTMEEVDYWEQITVPTDFVDARCLDEIQYMNLPPYQRQYQEK